MWSILFGVAIAVYIRLQLIFVVYKPRNKALYHRGNSRIFSGDASFKRDHTKVKCTKQILASEQGDIK